MIVWLGLILAVAHTLSDTPYFAQLLPLLGRGIVWFALTYLYTWTIWGLAAVSGLAWTDPRVLVLFAMGGISPALMTALLVRHNGSVEPIREFWRFRWSSSGALKL